MNTIESLEARRVGYSKGVLEIFSVAKDEAERLGHGYIGTEHLLAGFTRTAYGQPLVEHGISLNAVRRNIEEALGRADKVYFGTRGHTIRVSAALMHAKKEAVSEGSAESDLAHLLNGLMSVKGMGARIMELLGLSETELKNQKVLQRIREIEQASSR